MAKAGPQKVGVVGVTGAVGKEIIDVLHKRGFEISELKLFASARSAGKPMETPFGEKMIEEFTLESARDCDVVFLAVSGDFALEWVPKLTADDGPLVIDNSSAYRSAPISLGRLHTRQPPTHEPAAQLTRLYPHLHPPRYDPDVPLVVPEINAEAARKSKKRLVANPNCTTVRLPQRAPCRCTCTM
jgi:aspartate-semialdehyde dehydrogenase